MVRQQVTGSDRGRRLLSGVLKERLALQNRRSSPDAGGTPTHPVSAVTGTLPDLGALTGLTQTLRGRKAR